jgi:polysaccharide transporter, PST family
MSVLPAEPLLDHSTRDEPLLAETPLAESLAPEKKLGTRQPKSDRLSDSVLILLTITVAQRAVGFGRSVLFCIWLSAEQLGEWDIGFGFLMLAAPVIILSLPGSFGRYVAYYRHRGQLRVFLRRVITVTAALASAGSAAILYNREWFSQLIFGRPDRVELVWLLTATLLAVIAYNVVIELLIALRMQRLASGLEFFNSVSFAALGAILLSRWPGAGSVIAAFGGACFLSVLLSLSRARAVWRSLPVGDGSHVPHYGLWAKIVPFIAALWAANWLGNLFAMCDRYILIHHSGWNAETSLAMVGQYHSSRIIPLLLITVCGLLGTVVTPYLSHDWELGKHRAVGLRLGMILKLTGIGLTAVSMVVVWLSPLLFGWLFRGKFDVAPSILALALAYASWSGMAAIARNYLWCAEKASLVSLAYLAGLLASVGLNLFLVPRFGLVGAVQGTCVAHVVVLLVIYGCNWRHGMRLDFGVWLVSTLPFALWFGAWTTFAVLMVVALASIGGNLVFGPAEKAEMMAGAGRYVVRLKRQLGRGALAPATIEQL